VQVFEETLSPLQQQLLYIQSRVLQVEQALQESPRNVPVVLPDLEHLRHSLEKLDTQIRQFERERQRVFALADVSQVVNSTLELEEVLRIVMDTIIHLTGAERAFLMLKDTTGRLRVEIARNWDQESLDESDISVSHTVINRVVESGEAVLTTNAQQDPRFKGQESVIFHNLRAILCVPLKVKGRVTGVIYADNRLRAGVFAEEDREILTAFANQAAVALENARLFNSVRRTLAEVTELKNLLDNVFASIASGVITADMEDKINLCNPAAEHILACKADEIVGQPIAKALAPLGNVLQSHLVRVKRAAKPVVGLEVAPEWPGRGRVFFNLNLAPLRGSEGKPQGVTVVVDDLTEKRRLEAMRSLFERMVSPQVIDQLDPEALHSGGKRTTVTVLFADIRGFTHFSEGLDPEQLVSVLNRYLAAAAEAILEEEGTIDKFMGDAVMAWFNAPIPQPDHTLRAVRAALRLRGRIRRLAETLPPALQLHFGVGIHVGEAVLGLIGTEKRLEYTAIGDSVNTAKRIQENAAADQILLSEAAYRAVADRVWGRQVAPLHAKGKSQKVRVYELLGLKETP
jgi:adenylate cyclase